MADEDKVDNPGRRDFLGKFTVAAGAGGAAAACWPFVSSMNPSDDVLAKATTEVNLDGIAAGSMQTVAWQGKPVFVVHRTQEQIAAAVSSQGGHDPEPDQSRVKRAEWLVVIGACTHLGCIPNREADGSWSCPCHGSRYDGSGRVIRGPAPRNLQVPLYSFEGDGKLVIGKA